MARKSLMPRADDAAVFRHPQRVRPFNGQMPESELPEGVGVIKPGSREWDRCRMKSRLEGLPHLEALLKEDKALLVLCDRAARTSRDKAMILDCYSNDIVKTIYAKRIGGTDHYMVVCTGADQIRLKRLFARSESGLELDFAPEPPPGMQYGTCSPFMPQSVARLISIIGVEDPDFVPRSYGETVLGPIGRNFVDVTFGGTDELALRLSVHMLYSDLVASLERAHGDKIRLLDYIHKS